MKQNWKFQGGRSVQMNKTFHDGGTVYGYFLEPHNKEITKKLDEKKGKKKRKLEKFVLPM